ncbi:sensor histidine kinase [Alkalicoccobacillus gibsonii]|uniref:histidine kinase n=1 Tax=Alkalicoccobacillus gibsonii TaxID=79881 RepID=A0ABU9VIK8_9BACI
MKYSVSGLAVVLVLILIEHPLLIQSYSFWFGMASLSGLVLSRPLWRSVSVFYGTLVGLYCLLHFFVLVDGMITPYCVYSILAIAASFEVRVKSDRLLYVIGFLGCIQAVLSQMSISFFLLILTQYSLLAFILLSIKKLSVANEEAKHDKQTHVMEYRALSRQLREQELNTAAKERNRIARDLHDSVGHQLTALMMQLQVVELQLQSMPEQQALVKQTKDLARNSLQEMRESVQALQQDSAKGLDAVIQLIRKLEAESHVRIQLVTKPGAMSVKLTDDQSVAVYRFIQEGLTNAMRHAYSREVDVTLEVKGEHSYALTMSNRVHESRAEEGFGLRNLRTRFTALNGRFDSGVRRGQFIIEAIFPITQQTKE